MLSVLWPERPRPLLRRSMSDDQLFTGLTPDQKNFVEYHIKALRMSIVQTVCFFHCSFVPVIEDPETGSRLSRITGLYDRLKSVYLNHGI